MCNILIEGAGLLLLGGSAARTVDESMQHSAGSSFSILRSINTPI